MESDISPDDILGQIDDESPLKFKAELCEACCQIAKVLKDDSISEYPDSIIQKYQRL